MDTRLIRPCRQGDWAEKAHVASSHREEEYDQLGESRNSSFLRAPVLTLGARVGRYKRIRFPSR